VFYDPDGDGPYADGQEALADVPDGGTFVIGTGTWDVSEEGRIVVDRPMNIRGLGWATKKGTGGTFIDNTGADSAVNEPVVEFNGARSSQDYITGALGELRIWHHGESPAVLIKDAIRTVVADCNIHCGGQAPTGLKYDDWAFFARAIRNTIRGGSDISVHVTGAGYAHEFYSNHFATGIDGATAFQTQRQGTMLVGGQCSATGANGTGIRYYNPGGRQEAGGYILNVGTEGSERPIVIDGESRFNDVLISHCWGAASEPESPAVTFGNTTNSRMVYPRIKSYNSGSMARWSDQSRQCGVVTDPKTLKRVTYTDEGAENPYIIVQSSTSDRELQEFPTGVPTKVAFNTDAGGPLYHDGNRWKRVGAEDYSPGN
jgi:hypothetical protein